MSIGIFISFFSKEALFLAFQMDQQMAARAPSYIYAPHREGPDRSKINIVHDDLAEWFDGSIMQPPNNF
jgi:hypothetical protein